MDDAILKEYYQIIKNKISQSSFEAALRSVDKLLYNFPSNPIGYYYKAVCEFAQEKYNDALKSYQTALELDPTFAKAYFNIGVCYYVLNKTDNALINIGKALIIFSKQKDLGAKQRCMEALRFIESERKGPKN